MLNQSQRRPVTYKKRKDMLGPVSIPQSSSLQIVPDNFEEEFTLSSQAKLQFIEKQAQGYNHPGKHGSMGQFDLDQMRQRNGGTDFQHSTSLYREKKLGANVPKLHPQPSYATTEEVILRERNPAPLGLIEVETAYTHKPETNIKANVVYDMNIDNPQVEPFHFQEIVSLYDDVDYGPPSILRICNVLNPVYSSKIPIGTPRNTLWSEPRATVALSFRRDQVRFACWSLFQYDPTVYNDPALLVNPDHMPEMFQWIKNYCIRWERKYGKAIYPTAYHYMIMPHEEILNYAEVIDPNFYSSIMEGTVSRIKSQTMNQVTAYLLLLMLPNMYPSNVLFNDYKACIYLLWEYILHQPEIVYIEMFSNINNSKYPIILGPGQSYLMDSEGERIPIDRFPQLTTSKIPVLSGGPPAAVPVSPKIPPLGPPVPPRAPPVPPPAPPVPPPAPPVKVKNHGGLKTVTYDDYNPQHEGFAREYFFATDHHIDQELPINEYTLYVYYMRDRDIDEKDMLVHEDRYKRLLDYLRVIPDFEPTGWEPVFTGKPQPPPSPMPLKVMKSPVAQAPALSLIDIKAVIEEAVKEIVPMVVKVKEDIGVKVEQLGGNMQQISQQVSTKVDQLSQQVGQKVDQLDSAMQQVSEEVKDNSAEVSKLGSNMNMQQFVHGGLSQKEIALISQNVKEAIFENSIQTKEDIQKLAKDIIVQMRDVVSEETAKVYHGKNIEVFDYNKILEQITDHIASEFVQLKQNAPPVDMSGQTSVLKMYLESMLNDMNTRNDALVQTVDGRLVSFSDTFSKRLASQRKIEQQARSKEISDIYESQKQMFEELQNRMRIVFREETQSEFDKNMRSMFDVGEQLKGLNIQLGEIKRNQITAFEQQGELNSQLQKMDQIIATLSQQVENAPINEKYDLQASLSEAMKERETILQRQEALAKELSTLGLSYSTLESSINAQNTNLASLIQATDVSFNKNFNLLQQGQSRLEQLIMSETDEKAQMLLREKEAQFNIDMGNMRETYNQTMQAISQGRLQDMSIEQMKVYFSNLWNTLDEHGKLKAQFQHQQVKVDEMQQMVQEMSSKLGAAEQTIHELEANASKAPKQMAQIARIFLGSKMYNQIAELKLDESAEFVREEYLKYIQNMNVQLRQLTNQSGVTPDDVYKFVQTIGFADLIGKVIMSAASAGTNVNTAALMEEINKQSVMISDLQGKYQSTTDAMNQLQQKLTTTQQSLSRTKDELEYTRQQSTLSSADKGTLIKQLNTQIENLTQKVKLQQSQMQQLQTETVQQPSKSPVRNRRRKTGSDMPVERIDPLNVKVQADMNLDIEQKEAEPKEYRHTFLKKGPIVDVDDDNIVQSKREPQRERQRNTVQQAIREPVQQNLQEPISQQEEELKETERPSSSYKRATWTSTYAQNYIKKRDDMRASIRYLQLHIDPQKYASMIQTKAQEAFSEAPQEVKTKILQHPDRPVMLANVTDPTTNLPLIVQPTVNSNSPDGVDFTVITAPTNDIYDVNMSAMALKLNDKDDEDYFSVGDWTSETPVADADLLALIDTIRTSNGYNPDIFDEALMHVMGTQQRQRNKKKE